MRALLVIGIAAARASLAPAPACHRARPRHHAATTPLLSTASADPLTGAQRRALRAHAGRLEAARSLRRLQVGTWVWSRNLDCATEKHRRYYGRKSMAN